MLEVVAWLQRGPVERESLLLKMLSSVPHLRAPTPALPVQPRFCCGNCRAEQPSAQLLRNPLLAALPPWDTGVTEGTLFYFQVLLLRVLHFGFCADNHG